MKPQTSFLEKPMDSVGSLFRERIYPIMAAAFTLLLMIYYLCRGMLLPETRDTLLFPVTVIASGLILLSIRLLREKKPPELRLLLQNACWVIITRLLLGRLNYDLDGENYWALMYFCIFGVGVVLNREHRDVFLTVVTVVLCTILVTWAAAGILTAIRGEQLPGMPWLFQGVSIADEHSLVFITLFDFHRNTSAIFFLSAICLMIYQCVRYRHWGWYAAAAVTIPLLYAIIALQHCRSAYLSSAVCISLLLGRLVLRKLGKHSRVLGIIAAVIVTGVFTVGLFESFFFCSDQIAGLSQTHQAEEASAPAEIIVPEATQKPAEPEPTAKPAETTPEPTQTPAESASPEKPINDSRSTMKDARTLTGRTDIWKALFQLIRLKPKIALWGRGFEPLIRPIRELMGKKTIQHMHNILFQQLLLAGFPGFLMYFFFLLSLAVRIVKSYLRTEGQGREESLILGIILTGIMIYGMFEPVMSTFQPVTSLVFCLLAGCFVGELSDDAQTDSV